MRQMQCRNDTGRVSDVAKAVEGLPENASFFEKTTASTKGAGIISHRFASGDGELMVIDEWKTAEQFHSFFAAYPEIFATLERCRRDRTRLPVRLDAISDA